MKKRRKRKISLLLFKSYSLGDLKQFPLRPEFYRSPLG
jgi:hypothetical protein